MAAWLEALSRLEADGVAAVLVTVTEARGSTPREAGCKMVVTRERQFDTIGGGTLEMTCVEAARAMLSGDSGPVTRAFPLGPALGQCCGGHVTVLFEPMRPAALPVAIFGAGHVGRALTSVLRGARPRVTLIDTRAEALVAAPEGARTLMTADPAAEVALLPAGAFVLVMTHDHQLDFEIVAAALARDDFAGVGLIGSRTKRVRFARRLALPASALARLICPIGLPDLEGKAPAEIAISVAAQILQVQQRVLTTRSWRENMGPDGTGDDAACGDCGAICARVAALA